MDGTLSRSGKPLLANDPHLGTRLPSTWYLAHMTAGDFDVIGATLPGRAGRCARAQQIHRVGRDQRGRRRAGSLSRAHRCDRTIRGVSRCARAAAYHQRNDRGERGAAAAHRREEHPSRTSRVGRNQRDERRITGVAPAAAARAARAALDGARSRRRHAPIVPRRERSTELGRVFRSAPSFRRAVTELRLRRRERPHRLLRTGTDSDSCTAATAHHPPTGGPARTNGPARCHSRSFRTRSTRRRISSSRPTIGRSQTVIRTCSGSSGPSLIALSASSICFTRRRRSLQTTSRRFRRTHSRFTPRRCCRCCSSTCARPTREIATQSRCCGSGTSMRGRQRSRRDLRSVVPSSRADHCRRRPRPDRHGSLSEPV